MTPLVLNGVDHVVYVCRDVENVLAWWTGTLGLPGERVEQWRAGEAPFRSVRLSATALVDLVDGPRSLFGARGTGQGLYVRDPEGNVVELRTYRE